MSLESADRVRQALRQQLESLAAAGVCTLPKAGSVYRKEAEAAAAEPTNVGDPQQELAVLAQEVAACTRCSELASTRTQTVFGVGNPQARLCFLGEAPGADEDRQGGGEAGGAQGQSPKRSR